MGLEAPSSPPSSSSSSSPTSPSSSTPHLKAFPSRSNSNSTTNVSTPVSRFHIRTAEEIQSFPIVTRFAFVDLLTTVLRLDFWHDDDRQSIVFCKTSFDAVMRHFGMSDKTAKSLKAKLEGDSSLNENIATLIVEVKEDEVVKTEGSVAIVASLLLSTVADGNYDSRFRVLLRHLCTLLGVSWDDFEEVEYSLATVLANDEYIESDEKGDQTESRKMREKSQRNKKIKRYLTIGAAGAVGGVLVGLTGGLAAPLVAGAAAAIVPAAAGLGTAAGLAIIGTTFGVTGAGLAGYKMNKRVGAIEEFNVETLSEGASLRCALAISGWIDKDTDPEFAFKHQWRHLQIAKEQYTLHYESGYLRELGNAIDYLMSFAVTMAIQHTLLETALAGLVTAIAWPVALLGAASVLDNPWNVCISRATEVGEHLAEVLLSRAHGKRPITLVGFSLGARVIFHCLLTLSKRPDSAGIIEDVILLGAPVSASPKQWAEISRVVGGRIINGYSETDWLLRFVYRTMSVQFSIAGTSPVEDKKNRKIVNYNLSHIVKGHLDYSRKLTEVLAAVGLKVSPHSDNSQLDLSAEDALTVNEAMEKEVSKENLEEKNAKGNEGGGGIHFEVGEVKVKDKKDNSDRL